MYPKMLLFIVIYLFTALAWSSDVELNISQYQGEGVIEGTNKFNFHVTQIKTETREEYLQTSHNPYGELGDQLTIKLQNKDGSWSPIKVPEEARLAILNYLESGSSQKFCDCHCFGAQIAGYPYPYTINSDGTVRFAPTGTTNKRIYSQQVLKPGDVILMGKSIDEINFTTVHTAVYIGEGLYISKLGDGGGLVVTNFSEILKAYPSDSVSLVEPVVVESGDAELEVSTSSAVIQ